MPPGGEPAHPGAARFRLTGQSSARVRPALLSAGPERVLVSARLSKSRAVPMRSCAGGVWRSLAARFVRDEEAGSSNLPTPTSSEGIGPSPDRLMAGAEATGTIRLWPTCGTPQRQAFCACPRGGSSGVAASGARCPAGPVPLLLSTCSASRRLRSRGNHDGSDGLTSAYPPTGTRYCPPWPKPGSAPRLSGLRSPAPAATGAPERPWPAWPSSTAYQARRRWRSCARITISTPSRRSANAAMSPGGVVIAWMRHRNGVRFMMSPGPGTSRGHRCRAYSGSRARRTIEVSSSGWGGTSIG